MKQIALTHGKYAIVDDQDFDWLNQWKWHVTKQGYAVHTEHLGLDPKEKGKYRGRAILMHRLINKTPAGYETDHINRNKLDNRRENLRTATTFQNSANRGAQKNNKTSRIRNISWHKPLGKWRVYHNGKHYGVFKSLDDAIERRDQILHEKYGDFADVIGDR